MPKNVNWWSRKAHRWCAVIFALPMLCVILSGLLLQVKKQSDWIQPPTKKGVSGNETPTRSWDALLQTVRHVPEAEVNDWSDIDRMDVRPSRGIVKVRCANRWEVQIDLRTGEILSSTLRRSDLIESLHDGSFFSHAAQQWIFLPNGIVLLVLWLTGLWLWYLPLSSRSRRSRS